VGAHGEGRAQDSSRDLEVEPQVGSRGRAPGQAGLKLKAF